MALDQSIDSIVIFRMKVPSVLLICLSVLVFSLPIIAAMSKNYNIPIIDLAAELEGQIIVYREPGQYLGHPSKVLLEDNKTMIVVYSKGHGKGAIVMKKSEDGGLTWSEPQELPAALTGDRHKLDYASDGRVIATFCDTTHISLTKGDWVGWVGTYYDIKFGREGQYRIRFMDNHHSRDCAYPRLVLLPDGTFVTTTYGHWAESEERIS